MAHDAKRESWERHPHPAPREIVAPAQHPVPVAPATQDEVRAPEPKKVQFDTYQSTITRMETHHAGLWEFDFALDKPMSFIAGQYVSVCLPKMKPAPFSIASSPVEKDHIVLGVEVVGKVTTAMSQLTPGSIVPLKGPFGNFTMADDDRKVCFLAGGIGITPFICMLRWIRDTHDDREAVLFYTCKRKDQFMWREELEAMRDIPNIKIVLTLTQEQPPGWPHRLGRISEAMVREELPDFKEYTFFSCGPPSLIDAMFQLLGSMGVPNERLKREAWH